MIRLLEERDIEAVCRIVNENWKRVYCGYVNKELITENGCKDRTNRMKKDFISGRLINYVYEVSGKVVGLLSIGLTCDIDKKGEFELWRIYIDNKFQNKGIGRELLKFTEEYACSNNYKEIIIWAFKGNVHALSFYAKNGYIQDKEDYLGEPYFAKAVRFNKKL